MIIWNYFLSLEEQEEFSEDILGEGVLEIEQGHSVDEDAIIHH